jgi:hypothetical protein
MNRKLMVFFVAALCVAFPASADEESAGAASAAEPASPEPMKDAPQFLLKPPTFVFQPGVVATGVGSASSSMTMNLRFLTVLPTITEWVSLVSMVALTPMVGGTGNSPIFVLGGAVPVPGVDSLTGGWLSALAIPVWVWAPNDVAGYSSLFVIEAAFLLNVGPKLMAGMPAPLSGLSLYFTMDQAITAPFRFAPALLFGVSLPLAPWGM